MCKLSLLTHLKKTKYLSKKFENISIKTQKYLKGMTMVEIMGVLIIVGIVMASMGMAYSSHVKKAHRDQTVNEMSVYSNNLGDAYYDLGFPAFDPADPDGLNQFKSFLNQLEKNYIGCTFDTSTLTPTSNGFSVEISTPLSTYESRYKCWFTTKEDTDRLIMIACSADDGEFSNDTYSSSNFGDDIVLIVKPKRI